MHQTIVIVGAGFCGSVLAAQLLRRPPADPTHIVLVERGTTIARGVAYAAHDVPYVLNVPAGRLSVDPDHLFYLGPMLRADHWEPTAVPELRAHAERLSRHLAQPAAAEPG